jgi:hypothetical protein
VFPSIIFNDFLLLGFTIHHLLRDLSLLLPFDEFCKVNLREIGRELTLERDVVGVGVMVRLFDDLFGLLNFLLLDLFRHY